MSRFANSLLVLSVTLLLTYWGWLLYHGFRAHWADELPDLGGLLRYLLGILTILGAIWLLAHLNYRWAFRRWLLRPATRALYWTWLCVLAWLLFEALQLRTEHEPAFVDENLLVTGVLLLVVVLYGYVADYFRTRREQLLLQQEQAEAELAALRAQINPHFLFNALNTIYNEAQRADNDSVADLIQQLAGIMRFSVQDARRPTIAIATELAFLEKYLALQQARLPTRDTLRIQTALHWDGEPAQITPLLLIPFVENAFQHGIRLDRPSFIHLTLRVIDGQLHLHLANSVAPGGSQQPGTGVGIANTRRRLNLLYPNRHTLHIDQQPATFTLDLTLTL